MRILSTAGAGFRHAAGAVAEAALLAAIGAALVLGLAVAGGDEPAGADQVSAAGKLTATISFADGLRATAVTDGADVSFALTRSVPDNDPVMWVTNKCYDAAGHLVAWTDRAVEWGASTSLAGTAGPFVASGAECRAYATLRPWRSSILGDALLRYAVGQ